MHLVFIPYGKIEEVELLMRDMRAQKHYLPLDNGKSVPIQAQVRILPFGIYEYVFPREDMDLVINSLGATYTPYKLPKFIFSVIRKFLKLKPIPKPKHNNNFLWIRDNVSIIPLGIRHDGVIFDELLNAKHEAL